MYIKHLWKFYKLVDLNELSKYELIDLITNAVEVEKTVKYEYVDRWIKSPVWQPYITYTSSGTPTLNKTNLTTCNKSDLVTLANSIEWV